MRRLDSHGWMAVALVVLIAAVFTQSYAGRVRLIDAQRAGCARGIADRRVYIREAEASWRANTLVAHDPRQPLATRRARAVQARENARAIRSLAARVPPILDCRRVFPSASPLPFSH